VYPRYIQPGGNCQNGLGSRYLVAGVEAAAVAAGMAAAAMTGEAAGVFVEFKL